jgi:DNA polymerase-3 subunit alpha
MTLLAADTEGLHNLFRLSSLASPRVSTQAAARPGAAGGVLARVDRDHRLPGGEVATRLRLGSTTWLPRAAAELADLFGRDNFYVEVMDHGSAVERRYYDDLMRLRRSWSRRSWPLTTCTTPRGRRAGARGAAVRAVGVDAGRSNRFKFDGTGYHLKSPAEMRELARVARRLRQLVTDRRTGRRLPLGVRVPRPDAAVPGAGR